MLTIGLPDRFQVVIIGTMPANMVITCVGAVAGGGRQWAEQQQRNTIRRRCVEVSFHLFRFVFNSVSNKNDPPPLLSPLPSPILLLDQVFQGYIFPDLSAHGRPPQPKRSKTETKRRGGVQNESRSFSSGPCLLILLFWSWERWPAMAGNGQRSNTEN